MRVRPHEKVKNKGEPAEVEARGHCPYFHEAKPRGRSRSNSAESDGLGYCYAYGSGYLRVASLQELNHHCRQSFHVRCPVYEWLRFNGRLSLVARSTSA
jgi:hypothetical protein